MDEAVLKVFGLAELVAKSEARNARYMEFLRVPALSCGIYRLNVGDPDRQTAHDEDEVYFVLKGEARIRVGDEERALCPGTILYVPADTEHGFTEITEDLSLLVFFGSGGPSGGEV